MKNKNKLINNVYHGELVIKTLEDYNKYKNTIEVKGQILIDIEDCDINLIFPNLKKCLELVIKNNVEFVNLEECNYIHLYSCDVIINNSFESCERLYIHGYSKLFAKCLKHVNDIFVGYNRCFKNIDKFTIIESDIKECVMLDLSYLAKLKFDSLIKCERLLLRFNSTLQAENLEEIKGIATCGKNTFNLNNIKKCENIYVNDSIKMEEYFYSKFPNSNYLITEKSSDFLINKNLEKCTYIYDCKELNRDELLKKLENRTYYYNDLDINREEYLKILKDENNQN